MAEGSSPAAKRVKVDSNSCASETAGDPEVNGERGKIAFVTGITGQVKTACGAPRNWTHSLACLFLSRGMTKQRQRRSMQRSGERARGPAPH